MAGTVVPQMAALIRSPMAKTVLITRVANMTTVQVQIRYQSIGLDRRLRIATVSSPQMRLTAYKAVVRKIMQVVF